MRKRTRNPRGPSVHDIALGARIREVRLSQDPRVSQEWLARELGCSAQAIQKYETGGNRVSWSRLCDIAAALDMDVIELIEPIAPTRFSKP